MELTQAREEVIKAALDVLRAERDLSDVASSAVAVTEAEDRLALAAKSLTEAVGAAPNGRKPRGWDS
jgi:hypothetical protein